jgi:hypothetical protein
METPTQRKTAVAACEQSSMAIFTMRFTGAHNAATTINMNNNLGFDFISID